MKIFISHSRKGREAEDIQKEREKLSLKLKEKYGEGVEIVETFLNEISEKDEEENPVWVLGWSIQLLSTVDGVVFGRDWYKSKRCRIERNICHECGFEDGQESMPRILEFDKDTIEEFLLKIDGIGEKTAKKIVNAFIEKGEAAWEI